MLSRTVALAISAPVLLATAKPLMPRATCSTGTTELCCLSVVGASDVSTLLGLLGITVPGGNLNVGLACSPISSVATGGGSCIANAVCCEDNSLDGLVAIGCTPVAL
ncbi:fungal hydrophobin [Trametes cingulata]|nr:fungal hydrophobin [Trametes cingulata]